VDPEANEFKVRGNPWGRGGDGGERCEMESGGEKGRDLKSEIAVGSWAQL
jgi:hypothetical protein